MTGSEEKIKYIGTFEEPLSADIAIIRGEQNIFVYDVGAADPAADELNRIIEQEVEELTAAAEAGGASPSVHVIISHFHADHMGNIGRVRFDKMWGGSNSVKKSKAIYEEKCAGGSEREQVSSPNGSSCGIPEFEIVDRVFEIDDGVKIKIFPIPSTHAKGCVGLEVNGEMAFVGDSLVPMFKDGRLVYNTTLLNDTIRCIEALEADKIVMSHHMESPYEKGWILEVLRSVYAKREQGEPYIRVGDFRKLFEMK